MVKSNLVYWGNINTWKQSIYLLNVDVQRTRSRANDDSGYRQQYQACTGIYVLTLTALNSFGETPLSALNTRLKCEMLL